MKKENMINCPDCGAQLDIDEVLFDQMKAKAKKSLEVKHSKKIEELEKKHRKLDSEKLNLERDRKNIEETINNKVDKKLNDEKILLKKDIKQKVEGELSEHIKVLEDELSEKSKKLTDLNKTKAEIERLKREKSELKNEIEAESEKRFNKTLDIEKANIHKIEQERNELIIKERDQLINQLKINLKDAHRKVEQGSMQVQGEVQELAIEEYLIDNFPLDNISEIKKGARGADCLQIINTRNNTNCGSIYYESKRTKSFQPQWIEKFRNDIREQGANIGVLITDAMPPNMERMGKRDGIWICSYSEFKGLCYALRESVVQISAAISSQENKGQKMEMLYDFLRSNEFRLQIEAIVEGFSQMSIDLDKEKRSLQGHWKKREKQIEKVLLNTTHMYSSIKGIAGKSIQSVKALELEEVETK